MWLHWQRDYRVRTEQLLTPSEPGMGAHACNLSTQDVEAGDQKSEVSLPHTISVSPNNRNHPSRQGSGVHLLHAGGRRL